MINRIQRRIEIGSGKTLDAVTVADPVAIQGDRSQGLSPIRNPARRINREPFVMGVASHYTQTGARSLLANPIMINAKFAFMLVKFITWTVVWTIRH